MLHPFFDKRTSGIQTLGERQVLHLVQVWCNHPKGSIDAVPGFGRRVNKPCTASLHYDVTENEWRHTSPRRVTSPFIMNGKLWQGNKVPADRTEIGRLLPDWNGSTAKLSAISKRKRNFWCWWLK